MEKGEFLIELRIFYNDQNIALLRHSLVTSSLILTEKYSIGPPGVHSEMYRSIKYFAYIKRIYVLWPGLLMSFLLNTRNFVTIQ